MRVEFRDVRAIQTFPSPDGKSFLPQLCLGVDCKQGAYTPTDESRSPYQPLATILVIQKYLFFASKYCRHRNVHECVPASTVGPAKDCIRVALSKQRSSRPSDGYRTPSV